MQLVIPFWLAITKSNQNMHYDNEIKEPKKSKYYSTYLENKQI